VNSIDDENSVENSEGVLSDEEMSDEDEDESDEESDEDDDEEMQDDLDEEDDAAAHEDHMRKLEDEAFERELRMLTMDALEKGKHSKRTMTSAKVSDTMVSASQFTKSKKTNNASSSQGEDSPTGPPGMFALSGANGMNFQLIKRGHKGRAETKSLIVPSNTNLAKVAAREDSEAVRERELLKTRVLQYEAESAEQAYSGDVYMDQGYLPEVRNRTLRMEDIDRQFGRSRPYGGRGGSYRGRGNSGGRGLKRF
jgi:regulator of nonsense transcripts 2